MLAVIRLPLRLTKRQPAAQVATTLDTFVPTQDSDRGCSESAVRQPSLGIAHIQACAASARHGCFGSRGCSGIATPLPRMRSRARGEMHPVHRLHQQRSPILQAEAAISRRQSRFADAAGQGCASHVPSCSPSDWRVDVRLSFVNSRPGLSRPRCEGHAPIGRSRPLGRRARPARRPARGRVRHTPRAPLRAHLRRRRDSHTACSRTRARWRES